MFEGLCLKQLTLAAWRAVPTSHWQSRCSISAPASLYLLESHLLLGGGSWLHTPFTVDHRGAAQGMQDPETEAREPAQSDPWPLCPSSWEPGRTVRSPKRRSAQLIPTLPSQQCQPSPPR